MNNSWWRRGGAFTLALSLLAAACGTGAHEWPSPPVPGDRALPSPQGTGAAWSGRLWAGPAAGAPPAPNASDCRRAPVFHDLPGPALPVTQRRRMPMHEPMPGPMSDRLTAAGSRAEAGERAERTVPAGKAATGSSDSSADRHLPAAPAPSLAAPPGLPPAPRQRPAHEPVTAGVVDDNADFGAYLAFRQKRSQLDVLGVPLRDLDVSERYRLTVHDAAGRPVPDAVVQVFAGSRPQPLWARTDAGGQVWLHPRAAGIADAVLEVRVRKASADGDLRSSALLQRGQRHQLQVRLDAEAPVERARLDLVFLVDATGSMADEIEKLRRSMQAMADQIARLPSRPMTCFALVAYRDRGDEFFVRAHDFTDDLGAFQRALGGLRAAAGGDTPEALNEALHTAVHRLSWRGNGATRLVVLVADAPPHLDYGSPWYDDDLQGALARGIKLMPVGASGLDPAGEAIFRQMAQFTGGRFVFLTYADATDPASGPGRETVHDVGNYSVESLDKLVVRLVSEELAKRPS